MFAWPHAARFRTEITSFGGSLTVVGPKADISLGTGTLSLGAPTATSGSCGPPGLTLTGDSYSVMLITPNGLETDSGLYDLTATAFESLLPRLDLRSFCLVAPVFAGVLDAARNWGSLPPLASGITGAREYQNRTAEPAPARSLLLLHSRGT